jgi:MraZ protein
MSLFLSNFINKIDKKGRVSVPSGFRAALINQEFQGIVAFHSFVNECIEACGMERIKLMSNAIDNLDPFSEVRDAFATAVLGGSFQLPFDGEGRVTLSEEIMEMASLSERACFVGKGTTFEIWQPERFNDYAAKAREIAKTQRGALHLRNNGGQNV